MDAARGLRDGMESRQAPPLDEEDLPALSEGLDALSVANEREHDRKAAEEEQPLHDMHAVRPEIEKVGYCPAAGESGAEHLGANQDRRADHGQQVLPCNPTATAGTRFHPSWPLIPDY